MRWTVQVDGGPRRVNHAAASVGSRVFSFGGYCTGENYRDMLPCDVFVLNTHNMRWSAVPKPDPKKYNPDTSDWPFQRYGHTVVAWQKYVVLFGGRSDNKVCNVIYLFDTETFKWTKFKNVMTDSALAIEKSQKKPAGDLTVTGQVPMARDGHSACVIDNDMYIYGGYVESAHQFCSDVYKLDLDQMVWRLVPATGESPKYRDFHTATAIGKKIYVFGGRCSPIMFHVLREEFYDNKVVCFDTETGVWTKPDLTPEGGVPEGRRSHSALNLNGNLVVFGGFNSKTNKHKNDLWMFRPDKNLWEELTPTGKGPGPRRRQAFCLVGSQIFVFGGTSPYHGPPIKFTDTQLQFMPEQMRDGEQLKLIDHSEMFVLDLSPSLKNLCIDALASRWRESTSEAEEGPDWKELAGHLPHSVMEDLSNATVPNKISEPLPLLDQQG